MFKKLLTIGVVVLAALIITPMAANAAATSRPNLDRIDQRALPLNGQFTPAGNHGAGATVYVLDSGVRITNTQFGGRASYGWDFVDNDAIASDCDGSVHYHGTNVAGIIAGATTGVASLANIVSVRVIDCNDSVSQTNLVAGMHWVATHAHRPAVVNMSLGFVNCCKVAIDAGVTELVAAGISVVVAAGNDSANACNQSPASSAGSVTVGSINNADTISGFSNWGQCVDIFAPGENIISAGGQSDTGTSSFTGTSQATPHVAGAAALYVGANPGATPPQVWNWIHLRATNGVLHGNLNGSPNSLLYVGVA